MNKISKYDLEERTATFSEKIIVFCKDLHESTISRPLISQLIRSSTSIGANYMEANSASSKKDFVNKIYICKKESQETMYWLRMFLTCFPDKKISIRAYWQEAKELTLIFGKIISSSKIK